MVDGIIPVGTEHSQALHALTKKYAEISGRIIHCRAEMDRLKKDLEHLKRVIEIFGPDVQVDSINIKRIISRDPFTKGKVTSFVLDILRESYEPQSPREIAIATMIRRDMNPSNKDELNTIIKRVRACLRKQRILGVVKPVSSEGNLQRWNIV